MTPKEILNQTIEAINNQMDKVIYPDTKNCNNGLAAPFKEKKLKNISIRAPCKFYDYKMFRT